MKNIKNFSLLFIMTISIIGYSQESNKISGGIGYFMPGFSFSNISDLNNRLLDYGYPELSTGSLTLGGGGHFIYKNFVIGGEGHGMIGNTSTNSKYKLNLSGGYGFFNFGYLIYKTPAMFVYPLLGIGGGGATLAITDRRNNPSDFNNLLEYPNRESYVTNEGFMLNLSMGMDFFVAGLKSENATAGWLIGLKIGYIYNMNGNEWYYNNTTLNDSPNSSISGPYVRFTIGGGGLEK